MKLRIVAGLLKGRFVECPDEGLAFRPTLERTRQSIADMLRPWYDNAVAADLCAGSGAFGFEMISRGAARVDFVEKDKTRVANIRAHAEKFGVAGQCHVIRKDAADFLKSHVGTYTIIFYDPPYENQELGAQFHQLCTLLAPGGIALYQRRRPGKRQTGALPELPEGVVPVEIKTFGDTEVVVVHRC